MGLHVPKRHNGSERSKASHARRSVAINGERCMFESCATELRVRVVRSAARHGAGGALGLCVRGAVGLPDRLRCDRHLLPVPNDRP